MKVVKQTVRWLCGAVGLLAALVLALQIYYRFTPATLSAEASAMLAETTGAATLTDNGFRLHGLRAPQGDDLVAYGKCKLAAAREYRTTPLQFADGKGGINTVALSSHGARKDAAVKAACSQGKPELADLPPNTASDNFAPGFNWSQKAAAAEASLSPLHATYAKRVDALLDGGPRGNDPDPAAEFPMYSSLVAVARGQIGAFVKQWDAGDRTAAASALTQDMKRWVSFANGTLIEAMIANAIVTQQLVALQAAVAREKTIDASLAQSLISSLAMVESLPAATSAAIAAEFRFHAFLANQMAEGYLPASSPMARVGARLELFAYDKNDSLNHSARAFAAERTRALSTQALAAPRDPSLEDFARGCDLFNNWRWDGLCMYVQRNATGRTLAAIALPRYDHYGQRTHDVRNLAAATRLTIEARRQAVRSDELIALVASAPRGARDVFTEKPFTYDPAVGKLTINLSTKSSVLGETLYQLPL
jgi:hypothetical protein